MPVFSLRFLSKTIFVMMMQLEDGGAREILRFKASSNAEVIKLVILATNLAEY